MQRYSSEPDDPWFRVGTIDVNSSLLVAALCTVSMLVYAVDKELLLWLWLISDGGPFSDAMVSGVRQGQVWRLVTWPMVNPPDIWTFLSIVIIWYFGKELERYLGRVRYLWFVGTVVVIPSVLYVLVVPTLVSPVAVVISGAYFLASATVIAFIATYPGAMGFFGVPFWIIAVVFEVLRVLQLVGDRVWDALVFLLLIIATSLLASRAFGLSELEWIPRVPLPAAITGQPSPRRGGGRAKPAGRRGRKGQATVTPIRPATTTPSSADLLRQAEIDILLDKINEHGIGSLTPEERRRLDEHSRRMREER